MTFSRASGIFENASKHASVRFREMKPEEYALLERTITDPNPKGMKVVFQERTTIGGYPAVLVTLNQKSQHGFLLRKWLLAVREPTLTMFIVVQSIETPEGYTDAAIRRMLNSLVARPTVPIEAEMTELPFEIGDRAGFRPVRMDTLQIAMTEGPSDDLYRLDQPVVTVAFTPFKTPGSSVAQGFAERLLKADPDLKEVSIELSQSFQHRGRLRQEIVGQAKDAASGKKLVVLQTLEFGRQGILRIKSVTRPGERDAHFRRFRSFADGIEMKR
ncbi:hypothetical protein [Microvirga vignae]|nr:hypothetical protein [Microvirga vignae]